MAYLSAEFLPGPHLANNLLNLGITETAARRRWRNSASISTRSDRAGGGARPRQRRPGPAGVVLPGFARVARSARHRLRHPLRVRHLRPDHPDGWQVEITDKWLRFGNPWEIARPEIAYEVKFGGRTEAWTDEQGRYRVRWIPETVVKGVAYDTPILGYRVGTCNPLRLWKAEAVESFDFAAFNHGDYYRAVEDKMQSENITKVLYPNDEVASRARRSGSSSSSSSSSCSLQDMIRVHLLLERPLDDVPREMGRAAQRHAPGHRRRRADAPAGGRAPDGLGRRRGTSRATPSPTPTTRCCPRRWRSGRSACSARCCRATSRSSTKSTGASSTRCAPRFPGDDARVGAACRSSTRAASATCAWPISPPSAATTSTASRSCTPSC